MSSVSLFSVSSLSFRETVERSNLRRISYILWCHTCSSVPRPLHAMTNTDVFGSLGPFTYPRILSFDLFSIYCRVKEASPRPDADSHGSVSSKRIRRSSGDVTSLGDRPIEASFDELFTSRSRLFSAARVSDSMQDTHSSRTSNELHHDCLSSPPFKTLCSEMRTVRI